MTIIVGLSSTPLGELAIERAVEEAVLRDVPVVLTSHIAVPRTEPVAPRYPEERREVEAALQRKARQLAERGVDCQTYLPTTPGTAAESVLEAAEVHAADLIVVGIQRRSPVGKLVLGSTSQEVLLAAPCAVLGVKLDPADDDGR